ncbi:Uncharacterised protein [Mycobacteroides abscessus]|nr:Uncharacterised protein [Mycobacteroides abscessus]
MGVRARVEVLVLAVEVDEHRAVGVDDAREPARDARALEGGPVEHRRRALGRPGRRARVARDERRPDERDEHDARGDLVRARRDPLAELASARRAEQEVETRTDGRDDEDREPRAAQRVDDEGARDGADRLLRAAEEAEVVLEVLGQALQRVRLPDGREVRGDLLDRDVGAQAER